MCGYWVHEHNVSDITVWQNSILHVKFCCSLENWSTGKYQGNHKLNWIRSATWLTQQRNCLVEKTWCFLVRDSICFAFVLYAILVRPSVLLSVTRVYHTKTVKVMTMKFSPYGSPITLVFAGWVSSRNSSGSPWAEASNKGGVGKTSHFYF